MSVTDRVEKTWGPLGKNTNMIKKVRGGDHRKLKQMWRNYNEFSWCCLLPCGCQNREESGGRDQAHQIRSYGVSSSNNATAASAAATTVEVNRQILMLRGDGLGGGGTGERVNAGEEGVHGSEQVHFD